MTLTRIRPWKIRLRDRKELLNLSAFCVCFVSSSADLLVYSCHTSSGSVRNVVNGMLCISSPSRGKVILEWYVAGRSLPKHPADFKQSLYYVCTNPSCNHSWTGTDTTTAKDEPK